MTEDSESGMMQSMVRPMISLLRSPVFHKRFFESAFASWR